MAVINKNLTQTARDLGVSLGALLAANPQLRDPDNIRAGTQLNVPSKRKLSASSNARQMSRILSLSSTGAPGGATFGALQAGTTPEPPAPSDAGPIQFGSTAAPATTAGIAETQAARAGSMADFFAKRYGITPATAGPSPRNLTPGGREVFSTIRQQTTALPTGGGGGAAGFGGGTADPLTGQASQLTGDNFLLGGGRGGDPRQFGIQDQSALASTSGQPNSPADDPRFISHLNSLISSDDRADRRRAEWIRRYAAPDSPVALEFDVSTLIRERSEGRLPGVATQRIWDEIAARMGTGITGTELLIQEGYIPSPYQSEVWLLTDDLPHYSALSTPGSSSYAARRGNTGGGGVSGRGGYVGGSNISNLYNWHVKITV